MMTVRGDFNRFYAGFFIAITCLSSSCKNDASTSSDLETKVVADYADHVFNTYTETLSAAKYLQSAVDGFLAAPSDSTLQEARNGWRIARAYYGKTEAFRFYDGPIDNGEHGVEGLLNAWPLDEAYVDYVEGNSSTGIINDIKTYPEITRDLLVSLNEKGGEENISCGYHAIEFMLWGQDLDTIAAGKRPYTDFIAGSLINDRRRTYLKLVTDLLMEHLQYVTDQWSPKIQDNYRTAFLQADPKESLQKIFTGIGVLAKVELAGERMFTAYDNASQEDEQSCFSDNTYADLQSNLDGIARIFFGNEGRTGLRQLLESKDPTAAQNVETQLKATQQAFEHMHQPFDRAIAVDAYRPETMQAILAVQKLGNDIANAASVLQLTINVTNVQ
ncbi:MAG TPA: imelysin family protein [Chitinophagales bacterium]|nr:imelysin family protein [Chitinophagales bacterium]